MTEEAFRESIRVYLVDRVMPGRFIGAVLANDLQMAALHADPESGALLREFALIVYRDVPAGACGSWEALHKWCSSRSVAA